MTDNDPVTQAQCKERNGGSMEWGHDTADALTKELKDLAAVTTRLGANTDRLSWVISDPDVGLVKQVSQLAAVVTGMKETQHEHAGRLDNLDECAKAEKEARKPWQAIFFGLLEKVLWSLLAGASVWLLATRK